MSDWKVEKKLDASALAAILVLLGSLLGWGISVEVRLSERATHQQLTSGLKYLLDKEHEHDVEMKNELDTDLRNLREQIYRMSVKPRTSSAGM